MSVFTDNGYPAFKGYATNVAIGSGQPNCGQWEARPGNSGHPPATLPDVINIIVTDNVMKDGPNISGNIKQIVTVNRTLSANDNYAGNPGHQGWGKITGYSLRSGPGVGVTPQDSRPSNEEEGAHRAPSSFMRSLGSRRV